MSIAQDPTESAAKADLTTYPQWLRYATWFGLIGMLVACLSRVTIVDPDLFHELALVREALRIGHMPRVDSFAYTPTLSPLVHHEWGTGAVLYLTTISTGLGGTGLILVQWLLSLCVAVGTYRCALRRGASDPVFSLLAPLALILAWIGFSTVRAQLFTLAFLVGQQLLLTVEQRRQRWWVLVWLALYVVWLNLHAGFLVGLGLFVIFTLERVVRDLYEFRSLCQAFRANWHLLGCWLLMSGLIVMNPYGTDYYRYLWRAVLLPRTSITEWSPLWQIKAWEFLAALIFSQFLNFYALSFKGIRGLSGIAMVAVPAVLAFRHARHLSLYATVWLCCAPAWIEQTPLADRISRLWQIRPRLVATFWIVLGVLGLFDATRHRFWELQIPVSQIETPYVVPIYPAGAVDYLATHEFRGKLHTPFIVGAFVSWKLHPNVQVSTDGRYEVAFPPGQVEELEKVYRAEPGWERIFDRHHPDAILVPWWSKTGEMLTAAGNHGASNWLRVYRDDAYSIYLREPLAGRFPITTRRGQPFRARYP